MKVIVKIKQNPALIFLVHLFGEELKSEVENLINGGNRAEAIELVFEKGKILGKLNEAELCTASADMILTEQTVHWERMGEGSGS
ncbi:MAG: hypothetical protein ABIH85_04560 [Candidatus Omnitrophota bacterium]|nr:hypothetical protein [Candidatus Omnitrophota bacterium]MBU1894440.1 hypothetical protein [Candidatus Omnitrophota bacterium]